MSRPADGRPPVAPDAVIQRAAPARSLRERRRAETAADIVTASRELFAEQGYAATRTADIARRAGVSDATLFRYFASKPAIALAGTTERVAFLLGRLADQPDGLGALDAARGVLAEVHHLSLFGPDDAVVSELALVATTPELWPELDAAINAAADDTALALAGRSGRATPTLPDRVHAHMIVGAIQAAALTWLDDPSGRPFTKLLDDAFDLLTPPPSA